MTTEDAMPVVAHLYIDRRDAFQYATNACAAETLPGAEPLVKQSDALAALTLVQAERDTARQAYADACKTLGNAWAERDAMQQERDELREALGELLDAWNVGDGDRFHDAYERGCALTPKATQQETRA